MSSGMAAMVSETAGLTMLLLGAILSCTRTSWSETWQKYLAGILLAIGAAAVMPLQAMVLIHRTDPVGATVNLSVAVAITAVGTWCLLRTPGPEPGTDPQLIRALPPVGAASHDHTTVGVDQSGKHLVRARPHLRL